MVLLNAVYFKGIWINQFKPSKTKMYPFYLGSLRTAIPAKFMRTNGYFRSAYLNEIHATALALPYSVTKLTFSSFLFLIVIFFQSKRNSLIILLPNQIVGLKLLESRITGNFITSLNSRLRTKRFDAVMIPKFRTEVSLDLVDILKHMGVNDLFDERTANLSRISRNDEDDLFVSNAFHRTYIDVNEKGTEAIAASGDNSVIFVF